MTPSLTYNTMVLGGQVRSGGCGRWREYLERLDTFIGGPVVAMTYLQVNHIRSPNYMYECHDPSASLRFADSLKYLMTLTYSSLPNITYCDDGRRWSTQRCSVRDIALCINCDNPCQEPGATFLNSCNEDDISEREDELKVLSLQVNKTIPDPSLSNLVTPVASIQKDQAVVEVDINVAAYVYCDIYTSLSAAESAKYEILVSRGVASYPSSELKASVTFVNLKPSTVHYGACTAEVDPKTSLVSSSDVKMVSFSTACCIPILVDLSYPRQILVNSYASNFIHVSTDKWPLEVNDGITLTPTLQLSDCLSFYPSSLSSVDAIDADTDVGGVFIDVHSCTVPSTSAIAFAVTISGTNAADYEIRYTTSNLLVEVVAQEEDIDPSLVNAVFKNSLNSVEVKFDRPIQVENLQVTSTIASSGFICSELFVFAGSGTDKCIFNDDRSSISIILDYNSILVPADSLTLLASKLTATSVSQNITVLAPMLTKYPIINVVARNEIGACEDLSLDVSQSTGSGGRPWANVTYSVTVDDINGTDITSMTAFLSTHGNEALTLKIPSTYLNADTTYLFTVYMCNFMSTCMTEQFSVYVSAVELPPIEISTVSSQTYRRHQNIFFEVPYHDTRTSSCNSTTFSTTSDLFVYQWSILQDGIEKNEYASQSKVPTIYYLPPYTLPSGILFELSLLVYDPTTYQQVVASINIYVEPEEVVSVIAGGDKLLIKSMNTHIFDGSESYDKEISSVPSASSTALSYNWSCTVQYVPNNFPVDSSCPLIFADNTAPMLEVDVGYITEGTLLRLYLQVTSTDGSARFSKTSTQLQVTHAEVPDILIKHVYISSPMHSRTNFPRRLKLNGTIVWPMGYARDDLFAEWNYEDEWNDGNSNKQNYFYHLLTPSQRDLSASTSTSSYLPFVLLTSTLPVQSAYTFSLSLYLSSSSTVIAKTSVTVYRNTPPLPGTLSVTPVTAGIEMDTVFTIAAELWDDEDLPLSYKFTYQTSSSQAHTVLQAKALSYTLSTQLPAGIDEDTGYR